MKKPILLFAAALLPIVLSSCCTSHQPVAYHHTDNTALVVESIDGSNCEVVAPTAIQREANARLLDQARAFTQHQTAVVILENYLEPRLGQEFRDRTLGWFIGLRGLGYQRIVFLRGNGVSDPNGLPTLAEYD